MWRPLGIKDLTSSFYWIIGFLSVFYFNQLSSQGSLTQGCISVMRLRKIDRKSMQRPLVEPRDSRQVDLIFFHKGFLKVIHLTVSLQQSLEKIEDVKVSSTKKTQHEEVVTPLMLDGTYLSRNFATLGPLT